MSRLRGTLSAACLAGALVLSASAGLRFARDENQTSALATDSGMGEVLTHGIHSRAKIASGRMPLATIVTSWADHHSPVSYGVLLALNAALAVLLLFAIGFQLHPYGGVIAASAAGALALSARDLNLYPDSGYYLLVLLTAGLLVRRARAPSTTGTVLFAAAAGATLLWRSPLAFLPAALALYEWAFEAPLKSPRARRRELLILLTVPCLFLLPWMAMNWTIHRQVVVFEKDGPNSIIVTGALGLVQNIEGDLNALIDEPIDVTSNGAIMEWAVRRVLEHPAVYARACLLRLRYALSLHPWIALFSALGLWFFRKRREHRALGFMAAYFIGIHCLMTVEERYFWPAWPLLALLAASLPAAAWAARRPADDSLELRFSSAFLKGALAFVLALCLNAHWTVLSFARLARTGGGTEEEALTAALEASPGDAWLLEERGGGRLRRGELSGAAADYARLAALEPLNHGASLRLAWIEALRGKPGGLLAWSRRPVPGRDDSQLHIDKDVFKALAYLRMGRKREALERLREAHDLFLVRDAVVRGPHGERERRVLGALRANATGFSRHCRWLLGARPAAEKQALNAALARLIPDSGDVWVERATLAAAAGRPREALKALERAGGLRPNPALRRRMALVYRGLKKLAPAAALLDGLILASPSDIELRLDRAEVALEAGDAEGARASLAAAEGLGPDDARLLRIAVLHGALNDERRALRLLETLSRRRPRDARLWLERAEIEARSNEPGAALASLARSEALVAAEDGEQRRRIGIVYQKAGAHDRAIEVFADLTRRFPADASFHSDKALSEHLRGASAAALAGLRTAIRLDRKHLPAYLTLGAIHAENKRFAEEIRVYDEALAKTSPEDMDVLRDVVLSARRDAASRAAGERALKPHLVKSPP